MALFNTGAGLFLGGVARQQNVDRQLSVQEAGLDLQKTRLKGELDKDQKDTAMSLISEQIKNIIDLKKQDTGSSEEFRQKMGNSLDLMVQQMADTAAGVGLGQITAESLNFQIDNTKTSKEESERQALDKLAQSEALQGGGVSQPAAETSAGFGAERSNVAVLQEERDAALAAGDTQTAKELSKIITKKGTIVGRTAEDLSVTGFSPKDTMGIRNNIESFQANIKILEDTFDAFTANPLAGGISGVAIETLGGIAEQIPLIGGDIANAIADPETREKIGEARSQARFAVSRMLSTITGEESGRFTEQERALAERTLKALDSSAGPTNIKAAFNVAIRVMKETQDRELNKLLSASGADIKQSKGREAFFNVLVKNGLSEDEAFEILLRMLETRGIPIDEGNQ